MKRSGNRGCTLASITNGSTVNGDGIRTVIWFQGCNHNCKGCHSPHTHNIYDGTFYSNTDIITAIKSNLTFIDGITISGGDPLAQPEQLKELLLNIREELPRIHIWLWTGFSFAHVKQYFPFVLNLVDTLVDGVFIEALKSDKRHVGSSNQMVRHKYKGWEEDE